MPAPRAPLPAIVVLALALTASGCVPSARTSPAVTAASDRDALVARAAPSPPSSELAQRTARTTPARPPWLGTRPLALRADGFGVVEPTPPELRDRRLPPGDDLGSPDGGVFASTIEPVPPTVLARSTWSGDCPVSSHELRYLRVSFWGFDDRAHTGELLVNAAVAEDLVQVFERLYAARFPIEEMRVISPAELDAPPTGDGNVTTAFVCRPVPGSQHWSQHAYGLAVDINPFHNPYVRGDLVLPELASAYRDRSWERPGMVLAGDVVTEAFDAIGWGWGGDWRSLVDPMHFSATGR